MMWPRARSARDSGMRRQRDRGYSVLELIIVLALSAIVLAIAVPRTSALLDKLSVQSAAADVAATLGSARTYAIAAHAAVAVDVDTAIGTLRVRRGAELLFSRDVARAHNVRLKASRDSLAFGPRGLGRGAANLSIVVMRRTAVETVFVSRLGRVR
jgi:prepilin-type N-terminal cleavage/methylation domain-containing protein